jgi:hypothetical protein
MKKLSFVLCRFVRRRVLLEFFQILIFWLVGSSSLLAETGLKYSFRRKMKQSEVLKLDKIFKINTFTPLRTITNHGTN